MNILEVNQLDKCYFSGQKNDMVHAVRQVSFSIHEGEFLGLVGESGCGKSTIAKIIMGLQEADHGQILLAEKPLNQPYEKDVYRNMQMVFQLPRNSFDPRKTIGTCLTEIQTNFGAEKAAARKKAGELLKKVGLSEAYMKRYPHQLSGGECQRAAIARAISVSPRLMICDEITSALDVSIQAQIVELLQELRKEMQLSMLFISHDLALVKGLCDRILVMYNGQIIEEGTGEQLLDQPREEYTKKLFASVFDVDDIIHRR